ncbi:hypothetical protein D920_02098 [Enterococcus faecalis 13-SD-W-01]|nr:hypothetical protein D920_02098 [Enterococcus faecalis 13-SD-W-01]
MSAVSLSDVYKKPLYQVIQGLFLFVYRSPLFHYNRDAERIINHSKTSHF